MSHSTVNLLETFLAQQCHHHADPRMGLTWKALAKHQPDKLHSLVLSRPSPLLDRLGSRVDELDPFQSHFVVLGFLKVQRLMKAHWQRATPEQRARIQQSMGNDEAVAHLVQLVLCGDESKASLHELQVHLRSYVFLFMP